MDKGITTLTTYVTNAIINLDLNQRLGKAVKIFCLSYVLYGDIQKSLISLYVPRENNERIYSPMLTTKEFTLL